MRRPKLFIVGPLLAKHPGWPVTQAELVMDLFARAGYEVMGASSVLNRPLRMLDMICALVLHGRSYDIQWLTIYSSTYGFTFQDVASWLGKKLGQRVVMILIGGGTRSLSERRPRWFKHVIGRADALVATSSFLAEVVASHCFDSIVIPNVVDTSGFPFRQRTSVQPKLYWRRSFAAGYNPELALRTLAQVRSVLPGATLTMAGQDKGLLQPMKELAGKLGIMDAVSFPGFIPQGKLASVWDAHDIYLNTNRIDNLPVSIIEAFAMGLPVVATDVGGVKDLVINGQTGFLVPDGDSEAMARAVVQLVEEPQLAARFSSSALELAKRCSWDRVRPQYEELFDRLSQEGGQEA